MTRRRGVVCMAGRTRGSESGGKGGLMEIARGFPRASGAGWRVRFDQEMTGKKPETEPDEKEQGPERARDDNP